MFDSIKKLFDRKKSADPKIEPETQQETQPETELEQEADVGLQQASTSNLKSAATATAIETNKTEVNTQVYPRPTPQELKLEAVFAQAAHETNKRIEFIQALMDAELFLIGESLASQDGNKNIQLATQTSNDEPVALAFTSRAVMLKSGVPEAQQFVKVKGFDLVRMITGQIGFLLNAGQRVAKQFTKLEVEQLAGGAGQSSIREVPIDENAQMQVGQPSEYPPGLLDSLRVAVTELTEINAIYTGLMTAGESEPSSLLAVISTAPDMTRDGFINLVNLLSTRVSGVLGTQPINFAPLNPAFSDLIDRKALIDVAQASGTI